MIHRVTIALGFVLIAMLGYLWRRGPTLLTSSTQLAWQEGAPDSARLRIVHSVDGVDFARVSDSTGSSVVVRKGNAFIPFPDLDSFRLVGRYDGWFWALAEAPASFGRGPFVLLVSEDDGLTFERRGPIHGPAGVVAGWVIRGREIELKFSSRNEENLSAPWLWPWWRPNDIAPGVLPDFVYPSVGPGVVTMRSKNGGRSWRLDR